MKYIEPNPQVHQYVIGIDFGQGETSAAICPIQWNDRYNQLSIVNDIELPTKRSIYSVLFMKKQDDNSVVNYVDNKAEREYIGSSQEGGFYAYWKKIPSKMNEEEKYATIQYMKEVYSIILSKLEGTLTGNNHLVYIACPSDSGEWSESEKQEYAQLALSAGLPLVQLDSKNVGIIRESRAAFIKVRHMKEENIKSGVTNGVVVLDCGSSTFDLTYYSSGLLKPIDTSYKIGAQIYEKTILDYLCSTSKDKELLSYILKYKVGNDIFFELQLRKVKENYYNEDQVQLAICFPSSIIHKATNQSKSVASGIEENISENTIYDLLSGYRGKIEENLKDFRDNYIKDKNVALVFMTGGASRMTFIKEIVRNVFCNAKVLSDYDPSLTISNGIALTGRADLRTYALQTSLLNDSSITNSDFASQTIENAANTISAQVIDSVSKVFDDFLNGGKNSINNLDEKIKNAVNDINLSDHINKSYNDSVKNKSGVIIDELNRIVRDYFPDYQIPQISSNGSFTVSIPTSSMSALSSIISTSFNKIEEGFWETCGKGLVNVLGSAAAAVAKVEFEAIRIIGKLFGWWDIEIATYGEIQNDLTIGFRDKSTSLGNNKRKKIKDEFDSNKDSYKSQLLRDIKNHLNDNSSLKSQINDSGRTVIKQYIIQQIDNARLMLN